MTIYRDKSGVCCPQTHQGFSGVWVYAFGENVAPPGDLEWLTSIVEEQAGGETGVSFCIDDEGAAYWWLFFLAGRNGECFSEAETRIVCSDSDPVTRRDAGAIRTILQGLAAAGLSELRAELAAKPYPCLAEVAL